MRINDVAAELAEHAEKIARALLGDPNKALSTKAELRWGNDGSLAVRIASPKRGTWFSHEENIGGGMLDLIEREKGLTGAAAFDWVRDQGIDIPKPEKRSNGNGTGERRVVETYVYRDRHGEPVYRVLRWEPKSFSQQRWDPAEYQWIGSKGAMDGVERVPYLLPEMLESDSTILITEGEKHADRLAVIGFTATTSPAGAGKWPAEFGDLYFVGRDVVVLPDNDQAGRGHARMVADSLLPVASQVRILEIPGIAAKGDVLDWLEAGGTAEQLQALLDAAPNATDVLARWQREQKADDDGLAWPDPDLSVLSVHRLPAPRLPLEVFGDYWAGWISSQAEAKSCAPDYVAIGLLGGAGVLIGNARWGLPWDGWSEPPILWTAGVGTPSSGKSPGLDAIRDLLAAIEADASSGRKEELREWDTQTRAAKLRLELWEGDVKVAIKGEKPPPPRPENADVPERPIRKRIMTNDPTIEKLARILVENPKGMLLFRDELSGWIGSLERYGGTGSDRAFYLEAYGGRSYAVDRVKDPEPIIVPALSVGVMGGIQPDRLNSLVLCGDDDGLAARLLYVWPERVPPKRPTRCAPSGAKTKLGLLHALKEMRDQDGARVPMRFSESAASALQAYRGQVAEAEVHASGLFLSWMGKLPGLVVRIATILEHLFWVGDRENGAPPAMISERAAVAAIAFLDSYAVPMAQRCFGEASLPQADRDAIALARWIAGQKPFPDRVNARALRHAVALPTRDAERYDAALAELAEAGWAQPAPARSGSSQGRPRKDWELNPQLKDLLS